MVEQKKSKKDIVKNGIIGFFDVLGYGSLLENNEPEEIYNVIFPVLDNLKNETSQEMKVILKRHGKEINIKPKFQPLIDSIDWIVFSDTILITLDTDIYSSQEKWLCWSIFLTACHYLQKKLFKFGLPLRGAINYGKFCVEKTFFAGRSIINAYKLCKELEFAGCVLTKNASEQLNNDIKAINKLFKIDLKYRFTKRYYVPQKNKEELMDVVSAMVLDLDENDIHSKILECFWSHNKNIPISVHKKVFNTEKWINFLKIKKNTFK